MPRNTHFSVRRDFAFASTYNTHSLPQSLCVGSISPTTLEIAWSHCACNHCVSKNFAVTNTRARAHTHTHTQTIHTQSGGSEQKCSGNILQTYAARLSDLLEVNRTANVVTRFAADRLMIGLHAMQPRPTFPMRLVQ